jgi:hypothetical protein
VLLCLARQLEWYSGPPIQTVIRVDSVHSVCCLCVACALSVLTFSLVSTGGLFATLLIRWMLTTVGTTVRIPAGFFTPMIMIGAIIGTVLRCCGAILTNAWGCKITHPSINRSQGLA